MAEDYQGLTPPPELVQQWVSLACEYEGNETWMDLAIQAARWAADQELEACCKLLELSDSNAREFLRAARRPKPPSLAEEALNTLSSMQIDPVIINGININKHVMDQYNIIRTALERLQELENNG